MRSRWRGDKFKELLWNCSTTYTVQEFEKEMEEVRKLNQECYEWLKQIPPQHSARSHFTGLTMLYIIIYDNYCCILVMHPLWSPYFRERVVWGNHQIKSILLVQGHYGYFILFSCYD